MATISGAGVYGTYDAMVTHRKGGWENVWSGAVFESSHYADIQDSLLRSTGRGASDGFLFGVSFVVGFGTTGSIAKGALTTRQARAITTGVDILGGTAVDHLVYGDPLEEALAYNAAGNFIPEILGLGLGRVVRAITRSHADNLAFRNMARLAHAENAYEGLDDLVTPQVAKRVRARQLARTLLGDDPASSPLRQAYQQGVRNIPEYARTLMREGYTPMESARFAWQARRDLGLYFKQQSPWPVEAFIRWQNLGGGRYTDPLGPTWEFMLEKYRGNPAAIIAASGRYNPDINKFFSQFDAWLYEQSDVILESMAEEFLH